MKVLTPTARCGNDTRESRRPASEKTLRREKDVPRPSTVTQASGWSSCREHRALRAAAHREQGDAGRRPLTKNVFASFDKAAKPEAGAPEGTEHLIRILPGRRKGQRMWPWTEQDARASLPPSTVTSNLTSAPMPNIFDVASYGIGRYGSQGIRPSRERAQAPRPAPPDRCRVAAGGEGDAADPEVRAHGRGPAAHRRS